LTTGAAEEAMGFAATGALGAAPEEKLTKWRPAAIAEMRTDAIARPKPGPYVPVGMSRIVLKGTSLAEEPPMTVPMRLATTETAPRASGTTGPVETTLNESRSDETNVKRLKMKEMMRNAAPACHLATEKVSTSAAAMSGEMDVPVSEPTMTTKPATLSFSDHAAFVSAAAVRRGAGRGVGGKASGKDGE
jgi:hypothetical protein